MVADKISDVYARALVELAQAENKIEDYESDLNELNQLITSDPSIWNFFKSPLLGLDEKKKVMDAAFKKSLSKTVYNFLGVLAERRRFDVLSQILESYGNFADDVLGRRTVSVKSAVQIDEKQLETIRTELERFLGKKVIFDYKIDPDLLGGVVVKSGDIMMDTSLKNSLGIIKQRLVGKKILGEEYYEN